MASLHMAVPRASLALHARQLQHRLRPLAIRAASTAPPKPRVLEKPERFNPPSHPSRLRSKPRPFTGPPLSEHERKAQKTRRYPHMFPNEGTVMFKILTSRGLHVWISMGVLVSLVLGINWMDFIHNSPHLDMLPPNSMFFAHPFAFVGRYFEVYRLYIDHNSAVAAEGRRQKTEDVAKRVQYKKAHGLENKKGIMGFLMKSDEEILAETRAKQGYSLDGSVPESPMEVVSDSNGAPSSGESGTYVDFSGVPQPARKKWLGIW